MKIRQNFFPLIWLLAAATLSAAPLPQRHPWQKTLRSHFATLREGDFAVELKPVAWQGDFFSDADATARYWMLFITRQADLPSHQGIRLPPSLFTLQAIEAGDSVNIGGGFMNSFHTAWWTQWPYPGNPYRDSRAVKLRSLVIAACDMMMQDEEHEQGQNRRSDYLGGSMLRYAYVFHTCRDALPAAVQEAYADGLKELFTRLENLTPRGDGGSDMEFFQLSSMWYAADALGGDFKRRALQRAHRVIDTITSPSGYELHGGAFDVSYQGIALRFLTWAAMLYNDPKIDQALHRMLQLKAHLSLPEPNGTLIGPTHFNTGTAADAPNDQWAWVSRDFAMAMLDETALYTIPARASMPTLPHMREAIKQGLAALGSEKPFNEAPTPWKEAHWNHTLNFAHDLYAPNFVQRLLLLKDEKSPLLKPLYLRDESFIRNLNDGNEFLAAKLADFAVVIHAGRVATKWANGVSGKSGGALSAYWTPAGGTYLLGRCRATQSNAPDEWDDANGRGPYTWASHAIAGRNAKGDYFSTARISDIAATFAINGNQTSSVKVHGKLGGHKLADPQGVLQNATYAREFKINSDKLQFNSLIEFGDDKAPGELWELLPCQIGPDAAVTKIELSMFGMWSPIDEEPHKTGMIAITRYGQTITIELSPARNVQLAPVTNSRETGGVDVRNIMIDLTPVKHGTTETFYTIRTGR